MKINLRALTRKDIPTTLIWNNSDIIRDNYSGHPFPVNLEMEEQWYSQILTSNFPTTVFGIEHISTNKLIGLFLLKKISLLNKSAELALYIGDSDYIGKGLSYEVMIEGLKFGFYKLGLKRIELFVLANNEAAIGLYEKCGFVKEGLIRQCVFKNGMYMDQVIMSILDSEFNG